MQALKSLEKNNKSDGKEKKKEKKGRRKKATKGGAESEEDNISTKCGPEEDEDLEEGRKGVNPQNAHRKPIPGLTGSEAWKERRVQERAKQAAPKPSTTTQSHSLI